MASTKLWHLRRRKCAVIVAIDQSLPTDYTLRLADLGFCPGETIECVRQIFLGGPRIYKIGESIYSIARDIADFVEIEEIKGL